MASSNITTNTHTPVAPEIPSKLVQDILATTGENIPEMFTRESGNRTLAADTSALPMIDCPVIDFALLSASHADEAREELRKFHSALVSWGCFQLINHGLSDSFLDEARELIREFFLLPLEERKKYLRTLDNPEGYGNDTILSQDVSHNWNDRLYLKVFPEKARNLNFWPQTPNFKEMLDEFTKKAIVVHETLLIAIARCLEIDDNSFIEECGETMFAGARINFYPKCPSPELVRGSRAHTDASTFTILMQDNQVEGLQILKDDKWFKVPIIPSALCINTGDQLEIMSNGKFKGAVHRVIANSEKDRLSLAMFIGPDNEKEIGPLQQLVNENEPALYKSTSKYLEHFYRHHPKGERPISFVKL